MTGEVDEGKVEKGDQIRAKEIRSYSDNALENEHESSWPTLHDNPSNTLHSGSCQYSENILTTNENCIECLDKLRDENTLCDFHQRDMTYQSDIPLSLPYMPPTTLPLGGEASGDWSDSSFLPAPSSPPILVSNCFGDDESDNESCNVGSSDYNVTQAQSHANSKTSSKFYEIDMFELLIHCAYLVLANVLYETSVRNCFACSVESSDREQHEGYGECEGRWEGRVARYYEEVVQNTSVECLIQRLYRKCRAFMNYEDVCFGEQHVNLILESSVLMKEMVSRKIVDHRYLNIAEKVVGL